MKWKISFFLTFLLVFLLCFGAGQSKYRVAKLYQKGWIKGKVTHALKGLEVPSLEVDRDVKACGDEPRPIQAINIGMDGALRNAVVYLKDIAAGKGFTMSATPPTLHQEHCDYQPHVQIVPPFSSIKITNADAILHSVHAFYFPYGSKFVLYPNSITYPAHTLFNIAMVASRKESYQQLGEPGIVKFVCDAGHYWMTAYCVVASHPYFEKVNDDGTFTMEDVPPGKYTLMSWHEYFGTQEKVIQVKENQPTTHCRCVFFAFVQLAK